MEGFTTTRLVCADCGHELEEGEVAEQVELVGAATRCYDCGAWNVREVDVDLREELVRAAAVIGRDAKILAARRPDLQPELARVLDAAREDIDVWGRLVR